MSESNSDCREAEAPGRKSRWMPRGILTAVCVAIVGGFGYVARLGGVEWSKLNAADAYYNLLVQGFRAGQLSLDKEVPPGLARLADPYDPVANHTYRLLPYRLMDLSYYKSRLYLYFGVTPALLLYWPFLMVTGRYVFDRQAVTIFCSMGFLASVGLLYALWRRYFAAVNGAVVTVCAVALGLATGVPVLLPRSEIYEVAISCGYMLGMLTLVGIWCALHEPERRRGWLATASVAYGLAVGARPSLLFGAVILLVPVAQSWRERRPIGGVVAAAVGPITLIGLGLMGYNFLRFGSPFDFGFRYQLGGNRQFTQALFRLRYLWFNFRVYFLEPVRWTAPFPFVHGIRMPPVPSGYLGASDPVGILPDVPVVWLALAAPLAWRNRPGGEGSVLRWFVVAVALLVGISALTVGLFGSAAVRYEVDFLPAFVLLAVIGILGLERALADQPVRRCAVRWGWGLLLGFSVVFNLLMSAESWGFGGCALGTVLVEEGHMSEGIEVLQRALRLIPDYADGQQELGHALLLDGQVEEAVGHCERALRLIPPDRVLVHNDLALALVRLGQVPEAIEHWEEALRIRPDDAEMHNNLGNALLLLNKLPEAIRQYEEAVRLRPDFAEGQYNLGNALEQADKADEAMGHYEEAVRLQPGFAQAQEALARLRATE